MEGNLNKRCLQKNEAVSPVIGVILMVAITIVLSVIIAGFVYGLPVQIQKPWRVAIDAEQNYEDTITITIYGGEDFLKATWINGTVNGIATCNSGNGLSHDTNPVLSIGVEMRCSGATPGKDHVVVIGHFVDDSVQVLIDALI